MIDKSSIVILRRKLEKEAWELKSLGEIAKEISFGGEFKKDRLGSGDYPTIYWVDILVLKECAQIKECIHKVNLSGIRNPKHCQYGDLLVAGCCRRIENLGKSVVYLGDEKPIIERDIIKIEHSENPKFLLHFLNSCFVKKQIRNFVEDTVIVHLKPKHLQQIKIPLPPKHIQDKVADFLSKFSSLNEQIEEELKRELDQRKKQYEYYKETILNNGANKWELVSMGKIANEIISGDEVTKVQLGTGDYPAIKCGDINSKFKHSFTKCVGFVNPELIKEKTFCERGDILVSHISDKSDCGWGVVAYLGHEKPLVGKNLYVIKHNQNPKFLSYMLNSRYSVDQLREKSVNSIILFLSKTNLQKIKILLPPLEEQNKIVEVLDKLRTNIENLQNEIPLLIEDLKKQYIYYREQMLNPEITN